MRPSRGSLWLLLGLLPCAEALAQDMEPRRWSHLPVGTDVVDFSYLYSTGELNVDPVLRIRDAEIDMHAVVAGYNRYFSLGGMTARADLQVPLQHGHWEGLVDGVPRSITRDGMADPRVRLSVNFAGAPALDEEEYREFITAEPSRTSAGAALAVRLPLGEYDGDQLINLGENRYSFQSQMGVLHIEGPWTFEVTGSVFVFTDNNDFYGGHRREQDPLVSLQGHVVRTFESGFWVSAGANLSRAGETEIDGLGRDDERDNLLYGAAAGWSLSPLIGLRAVYFRQAALDDLGPDTDNLLLTVALRF